MTATGAVTVRDVLKLLERWRGHLLAGERGLTRSVTWANTMRARLPAFEGFQGDELALLSLATLRTLRTQLVELSLPAVVEQLAEIGVSAIVGAGLTGLNGSGSSPFPPEDTLALDEARARADDLGVALIALPPGAPLADIERAVIAYIITQRDRPPPAAESPETYAARLRDTLRGEALDALLTGTYAGEAAMRARALQLGYDLTQPHAVLWIELPAPDTRHDEGATPVPDPLAAGLAEAIAAGMGAWARARGHQVAALLPLDRPDRGLAEQSERAALLLTRSLGDGAAAPAWSGGFSDPATAPGQIHRAATEARDAARLGHLIFGSRRIARPTELGVYRLLLALRDSGDLAPFVERTLAPLLAEKRLGTELVETLEVFFACNGNLSSAAARLSLHRNSLLYRLHRARALLGHDLDDPELRLALLLAIKGRRVLDL